MKPIASQSGDTTNRGNSVQLQPPRTPGLHVSCKVGSQMVAPLPGGGSITVTVTGTSRNGAKLTISSPTGVRFSRVNAAAPVA